MARYLLFDSSCGRCSKLARAVQRAGQGNIEVRSLRELEIKAILDQARPGWSFEPTLLELDVDRIAVFTGLRLRLRLIRALGISGAWRLAKAVRRADQPPPVLDSDGVTRRQLLRQGGAFVAWATILGLPTFVSFRKVLAQTPPTCTLSLTTATSTRVTGSFSCLDGRVLSFDAILNNTTRQLVLSKPINDVILDEQKTSSGYSAAFNNGSREVLIGVGTAAAVGLAVIAAGRMDTDGVSAADLHYTPDSAHTLYLDSLPPSMAHSSDLLSASNPDDDDPKPLATPAPEDPNRDNEIFVPVVANAAEIGGEEVPTAEPATPEPSPSEPPEDPSPSPSPSPTPTPSPTPRAEFADELSVLYSEPVISQDVIDVSHTFDVVVSQGPNRSISGQEFTASAQPVLPGGTLPVDTSASGIEIDIEAIAMTPPVGEFAYLGEQTNLAVDTSPGIILETGDAETRVQFDNVGDGSGVWEVNGENICIDDAPLEAQDNPHATITLASREGPSEDGTSTIEHYVYVDDDPTDETPGCEFTVAHLDEGDTDSPMVVKFDLPPHSGGFRINAVNRLVGGEYEGSSVRPLGMANRPLISVGEGRWHQFSRGHREWRDGGTDLLFRDTRTWDALRRGEFAGAVIDPGSVLYFDQLDEAGRQLAPYGHYEDMYAAVFATLAAEHPDIDLDFFIQSWINRTGPIEAQRFAIELRDFYNAGGGDDRLRDRIKNDLIAATRDAVPGLFDRHARLPGFSPILISNVANTSTRSGLSITEPWSHVFGLGFNGSRHDLHPHIVQRSGTKARANGYTGTLWVAEEAVVYGHIDYESHPQKIPHTIAQRRSNMISNLRDGRREAPGGILGNILIEDGLPDEDVYPDWEITLAELLDSHGSGSPSMFVLRGAHGSSGEEELATMRAMYDATSSVGAEFAVPAGTMNGLTAIDILAGLK